MGEPQDKEVNRALEFSLKLTQAMYLAQTLQQEGNIDSENDLIKAIHRAKTLEEITEVVQKLHALSNGNRSSGYR